MRAEYGRTALFVTHDADEAISLADRIIVLNRGVVVFDAPCDGDKDERRKRLIDALIA